jgi:SMI1 / KNR4 family (SUKH-1)
MSKLETTLRLLTGLVIILSVVLVGYMARSPWSIVILGAVFTVLFLLGKRSTVHTLVQLFSIKNCFITFVAQIVLCGILYFIGRGIGSFLHVEGMVPLSVIDGYIALTMLVFGVMTTLYLQRLSKIKLAESLSYPTNEQNSAPTSTHYRCEYLLSFDADPITLDNFFESVYYGHLERDATGQIIKRDSLPEAARTTEEMIASTEARLGVVFPPLLKQLYLKQNGGDVGNLWVPCVSNPSQELEDWRGVFSHDYCYLAPLQQLTTLYDSYLDYMDEDEIEQSPHVEKHAKDYVILCQRYMDTTFLDYSQSRQQPRVGIVDFEGIDKNDVWFDSFDDFFAALKRGELTDRT